MEVALRELAKKQEDLERREKAFEEAKLAVALSAPSSSAGTAGSASSPEQEEGAVSTASPSKNEASLAPQANGGSEALDGASATGGGGSEWVEYWDESAGASYYYNTITQVTIRALID